MYYITHIYITEMIGGKAQGVLIYLLHLHCYVLVRQGGTSESISCPGKYN